MAMLYIKQKYAKKIYFNKNIYIFVEFPKTETAPGHT